MLLLKLFVTYADYQLPSKKQYHVHSSSHGGTVIGPDKGGYMPLWEVIHLNATAEITNHEGE